MCGMDLNNHPQCAMCKILLENQIDKKGQSDISKVYNLRSKFDEKCCNDCVSIEKKTEECRANMSGFCMMCGDDINQTVESYITRGNCCSPCSAKAK